MTEENKVIRLKEELLNKGLSEAIEICKDEGVKYRVTKKDGVSRIRTMDFRKDRLNFDVKDGIVFGVSIG